MTGWSDGVSDVGLLVVIEGIGGSGLSLGRVDRDGAPLCAEEVIISGSYIGGSGNQEHRIVPIYNCAKEGEKPEISKWATVDSKLTVTAGGRTIVM